MKQTKSYDWNVCHVMEAWREGLFSNAEAMTYLLQWQNEIVQHQLKHETEQAEAEFSGMGMGIRP